jgi:glycosyltransferase involved in cell wall biosynthesis
MLRLHIWKPYSRLFIVGDNTGWSTDVDAEELKRSAAKLGFNAKVVKRAYFNLSQAVHYTSQFSIMNESIYHPKNRISVDYYHGKPGQLENERGSFTKCFDALKKHREDISMVRVSTRDMEALIKSSGISPDKVMRIPIGIDTNIFKPQTLENKRETRNKLGIPEDAVVVGSFQKDGSGWGEGNEPKLIKGPDIFLKVVAELKKQVPNLWVLLSGPSRGYVKSGLDALGIPYKHEYLKDFRDLTSLYDALDLYIVTSREEGGPKAILESMAKGVPLVTTEVGQAKDLVKHGENGLMAPQEDVPALSNYSLEIIRNPDLRATLVNNGLVTARENNHEAQLPLWREYLSRLLN